MTDIKSHVPESLSLVLLIPVFNDWQAVRLLLTEIDRRVADARHRVHVLLVDDGSTEPLDAAPLDLTRIHRVDVLTLRRNFGHQRAIAIGLAHVEHALAADATVVMDGDGEDDPDDVRRLVARMRETGGRAIIFADRTRRMEGWSFRAWYGLYRGLHRLLTGFRVRVGNFSVIPAALLPRLVVVSELWNHYAAAVFQSRTPFETVPTTRARRLYGRSRMNFVSLATHGLSAMSVHSEILGVRLLVATVAAGLLGALALGAGAVWALRSAGTLTTWMLATAALASLAFVQSLMLVVMFVFSTLHARRGVGFLPSRDYAYFIWRTTTVFASAADTVGAQGGTSR